MQANLSPIQKAKQAADAHYFANGLLKREEHQRLVDNIEEIACTAKSL